MTKQEYVIRQAVNALIAEIDALRERALPELPKNWILGYVSCQYSARGEWLGYKASIFHCNNLPETGTGKTPRDAVLAALAKIGEA